MNATDQLKAIVSGAGEIIRKGWDFYYTFGVSVGANKNNFKLEYNSPIQSETVLGIQTRRASANSKSVNGSDLVNDAVFYSSFLTLKQRNAEVFEKIPFEMIYLATLQGLWYPVRIPLIDMAQSEILCTNEAALVAGEEFELTVKYWNTILQKQ